MYAFALLCLALMGGVGGWLIGRLKTRHRWPLLVWVPLPLWLCLLLILPAAVLGGVAGLATWLIIVAMLSYPIASWTIAAGLCALLARRNRVRSAP